jgi:CHAT domain-containing protein
MIKKRLQIFFAFQVVLAVCFFISNTFAQTPPQKLPLNQPLNVEIKGGESHFYSVSLQANQTARIEVVQNGIEISLSAYNPQGNRYIHMWSLSGLYGQENILMTAGEAGEYKLEVEPYLPNAVSGKYTIILKEIRPSTAKDFSINRANLALTDRISQAAVFRQNGTVRGKREAIRLWGDVIELSKITEDRVWEAAALATQGVIFHDLGELQTALELYLKSLAIWQQLGNRQNQGSLISNLGAIYNDLGEFEKSISYYQQAVKFQRETKNFAGLATVLNNLATSYSSFGKYAEAKKLYREAIALDEKYQSGYYKNRLSNALHNLATTLLKNKEFDEGAELFLKALEIREEIKDYSGIAHSLLFMGRYLWNSKNYKELGLTRLNEARERARILGDIAMESEALYFLALAEQEKGKTENIEKAIEFAGQGMSLTEEMRRRLIDSKARYGYFSTVQKYYELHIDLLISRFQKTGNRQDINNALKISESSRSRSLLDLLEEAKVDFKRGNNPQLLEQLKKLQSELNKKYELRRELSGNQTTTGQTTRITEEINELNTALESLKLQIRRENPRYADISEGRVLNVSEMQKLLDDDSVLIEYKLGSTRSFMWLVTRDSAEVFILPPRRTIENQANRFYKLVVTNNKSEESVRFDESLSLSNILLAPVKQKISGKRLIIVADGALQYTPFSALVSPVANEINNQKLLTETNEIVILPSASVLARIRENPIRKNEKKIAIFADPVFDNEDSRIKNKAKASLPETNLIRGVLRDFQFGETLPRLLASRAEAREISALFESGQSDIKIDFAANLKNVETADLSKYKILHFATHGLINTSRPELSGLVFSLYNQNGERQNGFLSLNSIYNLDLSSDLVVLSACQTAFGKNIAGEGLIGLSRGFIYAGSNRVIASYWKVDDFATAEFMKRFYRNHLENEMPAAKALQQTKIEMKNIRRYRSPYYWSAFTLLGDWK